MTTRRRTWGWGGRRPVPVRRRGRLGEELEGRVVLNGASVSISNALVDVGDVGSYALDFVATLSAPSARAVTVGYATVGAGTAVSGAEYGDYQATAGVLTFAPGATSETVVVPVFGAAGPRPTKTLAVVLSNPVNATIGNGTASGTIVNDGGGALSVDDAVTTRGPSGAFTLDYRVRLAAPSGQPVTVRYATVANGTAVPGADFQSTVGSLTFAPGETVKTVAVPVLDAPATTPDRTLTFQILSPVGAAIGRASGVGLIRSDGGTVSVGAASAPTGGGSVAFMVRLSVPAAGPVTVGYATAGDGSAVPGVDYQSAAGTLTFAPGETVKTINVPVLADPGAAGDRTFSVVLSGASNAAIGQGVATGVVPAPLLAPSGGDDTAAVQAALDRGGTVRLGTGPFLISHTLRLTHDDQQLIGSGPSTVILCRGDFTTAISAAGLNRVGVSDLTVDCDRDGRQAVLTTRTIGMSFVGCDASTVVDCVVQGTVGGPVTSGGSLLYSGEGVVMEGSGDRVLGCTLRDLGVKQAGTEEFLSDGVYTSGDFNIIKDCQAVGVTDTAFVIESANDCGVMDCTAVGCSGGLGITNAADVAKVGNYAHNLTIDDWNASVVGGVSIATPAPSRLGDLVGTTLQYLHLTRVAGAGPAVNVWRTGAGQVNGLSIRDVTVDGSGTQGVLIHGSNVDLSDCQINNTGWAGVQVASGSANVNIHSCVIDNPTAFGISVLAPAQGVTLAGNTVVGRGRMNWGIYSFGPFAAIRQSGNTIQGFSVGAVGSA